MYVEKFITFIQNEFKVRDKILLAVILCGLLIVIAGLILFVIPGLEDVVELLMVVGQTIAEWTGLALLLLQGTVMQSKYWWYIVGSVLIILTASIFKILHLQGTVALFFVGLILLELVYTIRFVNQRYTNVTGWFKYLWICSWCIVTFGVIINKLSGKYYIIPAILFWVTFALFLEAKMRIARKYKQG